MPDAMDIAGIPGYVPGMGGQPREPASAHESRTICVMSCSSRGQSPARQEDQGRHRPLESLSSWLGEALREERATLERLLKDRHKALLSKLEHKVACMSHQDLHHERHVRSTSPSKSPERDSGDARAGAHSGAAPRTATTIAWVEARAETTGPRLAARLVSFKEPDEDGPARAPFAVPNIVEDHSESSEMPIDSKRGASSEKMAAPDGTCGLNEPDSPASSALCLPPKLPVAVGSKGTEASHEVQDTISVVSEEQDCSRRTVMVGSERKKTRSSTVTNYLTASLTVAAQAASRATVSSTPADSPKALPFVRQGSMASVSAQSKAYLHKIVTGEHFEMTYAAIIMVHSIVMAFEFQYDGIELGNQLDYRWYTQDAAETWPAAKDVFRACTWIFGLLYVIEFLLKLFGLLRKYFKDLWNWFDLLLVVFWFIEVSVSSAHTQNLSVLKAVRLIKLLRLIRVAKALSGMDALYLMITSLTGSTSALLWSVALLAVLQMLVAFALQMVLIIFYFDKDYYPEDDKRLVFSYFGSFSRSMLSVFEMTLANWPPVCRLLMEHVSEWFIVFCLMHKLTVGFAVIGVINGVFMQETFKVAATDDIIMLRQRDREVKTHTLKMQRLFQHADTSGDGELDENEFVHIMSNPEIRSWLSSMGLAVGDAKALFRLVDENGDGTLTASELVAGAARLKGPARSIDLLTLQSETRRMLKELNISMESAPQSPSSHVDNDSGWD